MTVKGGTTPACAACKYQRRKCSPTCPLAPYFPANQPKMFQNVHRLFGVSNVTRTLNNLKSKDFKDDAMRSIIYEAEMRRRFPVHGCCGVMAHLRHQLQLAYEELHRVRAALDVCRGGQVAVTSSGDRQDLDFWLDSSSDGLIAPYPCGDLASIQAQMELIGIQERMGNGVDFDDQVGGYVGNKIGTKRLLESSPESVLCDVAAAESEQSLKGSGVPVENGCRRELRTAARGFRLTAVN